MQKVNLAAKLAQIPDLWSPHIVGDVQNMHVKVARIKGEFVWHHHEAEDELFLVIKGRLLIQLRDPDTGERDVWLDEGEMLVIPHGIEHRPVAPDEVHILLFEPQGTLNTGNVRNDHTLDELKRL